MESSLERAVLDYIFLGGFGWESDLLKFHNIDTKKDLLSVSTSVAKIPPQIFISHKIWKKTCILINQTFAKCIALMMR